MAERLDLGMVARQVFATWAGLAATLTLVLVGVLVVTVMVEAGGSALAIGREGILTLFGQLVGVVVLLASAAIAGQRAVDRRGDGMRAVLGGWLGDSLALATTAMTIPGVIYLGVAVALGMPALVLADIVGAFAFLWAAMGVYVAVATLLAGIVSDGGSAGAGTVLAILLPTFILRSLPEGIQEFVPILLINVAEAAIGGDGIPSWNPLVGASIITAVCLIGGALLARHNEVAPEGDLAAPPSVGVGTGTL